MHSTYVYKDLQVVRAQQTRGGGYPQLPSLPGRPGPETKMGMRMKNDVCMYDDDVWMCKESYCELYRASNFLAYLLFSISRLAVCLSCLLQQMQMLVLVHPSPANDLPLFPSLPQPPQLQPMIVNPAHAEFSSLFGSLQPIYGNYDHDDEPDDASRTVLTNTSTLLTFPCPLTHLLDHQGALTFLTIPSSIDPQPVRS